MPFITEELYTHLPNAEETIMLSAWPRKREEFSFPKEAEEMEAVMELIRSIRNVRAEMNVPPAKRIHALLIARPGMKDVFADAGAYVNKLAGVETLEFRESKQGIPSNAVAVVSPAAEAYIPLAELVDLEKERERVNKEIARMEGEIARAEGKLNNPGFTGKAPQRVVEEEQKKLDSAKDMLEKLKARLGELA